MAERGESLPEIYLCFVVCGAQGEGERWCVWGVSWDDERLGDCAGRTIGRSRDAVGNCPKSTFSSWSCGGLELATCSMHRVGETQKPKNKSPKLILFSLKILIRDIPFPNAAFSSSLPHPFQKYLQVPCTVLRVRVILPQRLLVTIQSLPVHLLCLLEVLQSV